MRKVLTVVLLVALFLSGCVTSVPVQLEVEELASESDTSYENQQFCRMVIIDLYSDDSLLPVEGYIRVKAYPEGGGPTGVYLAAKSNVTALSPGSLASITLAELKKEGETISSLNYVLAPLTPAP